MPPVVRFPSMPLGWYAEQKAKASNIRVREVHLHGNRRTRRYLIDRELLRCELAETLEQLEELLEEAVEALTKLGVFLAVEALIDQAETVGLSRGRSLTSQVDLS